MRKSYTILCKHFRGLLGSRGNKQIVYQSTVWTWRLPFLSSLLIFVWFCLFLNFWFCLLIIFDTFRTLKSVYPTTISMKGFAAGAKQALSTVLSSILACHSYSFKYFWIYLLKLSFLPKFVVSNIISYVIGLLIWPMFIYHLLWTSYCG